MYAILIIGTLLGKTAIIDSNGRLYISVVVSLPKAVSSSLILFHFAARNYSYILSSHSSTTLVQKTTFTENSFIYTMSFIAKSTLFFVLGLTLAAPTPMTPASIFARDLDTTCAPGGNFDLAPFNLQLPTGADHKPDQIKGDKLVGCEGHSDIEHFFTSPDDGALVFKVPGSPESTGCVTTKNSKHCRTELREAQPNSWSPKADVNRLRAAVNVVKADDSKHGTVVGQIHVDDKISKKPVCELFVNQEGVVEMGVEQIPDESSLKYTKVGKITIGQQFEYEIRYEKGKLSVIIDGGEEQFLDTGALESPDSYFKAGNYNQGDSPSEVHFYSIEIEHA